MRKGCRFYTSMAISTLPFEIFLMTIKSDMIYIKRIDASKIREYISLESRMMVE